MLDRPQGVGGNPQSHPLPKNIADQRHLIEIGEETPARFLVRVTDIIAGLDRLAGQFAAPSHGKSLESIRNHRVPAL